MESGTKGNGTRALADRVLENPLRARLVAELRGSRMSPSELAETLGKPLPLVTYHCRVLSEAGGLEMPGGA